MVYASYKMSSYTSVQLHVVDVIINIIIILMRRLRRNYMGVCSSKRLPVCGSRIMVLTSLIHTFHLNLGLPHPR